MNLWIFLLLRNESEGFICCLNGSKCRRIPQPKGAFAENHVPNSIGGETPIEGSMICGPELGGFTV